MVNELSHQLPEGWVLVAKTHPLEDDDFNLSNKAIFGNSFHIKDLLDISDSLLTFNSGVGVLAMAWGIPTMIAGNAFYYHPDINAKVSSKKDVLDFISEPDFPKSEKVIRFYSYLINVVYSFGNLLEKKVKMPDGSRMTATTDISYRQIRWVNGDCYCFSNNEKPKVSWEAFLFDRYRFELSTKTSSQANAVVKNQHLNQGAKQKGSLRSRRLKKLFKSPRRYLLDSQHRLLRAFGRVLS